jgi:hypothetical protein
MLLLCRLHCSCPSVNRIISVRQPKLQFYFKKGSKMGSNTEISHICNVYGIFIFHQILMHFNFFEMIGPRAFVSMSTL